MLQFGKIMMRVYNNNLVACSELKRKQPRAKGNNLRVNIMRVVIYLLLNNFAASFTEI